MGALGAPSPSYASLVQNLSAEVEVPSLLRAATPTAMAWRDFKGVGEGAEGVRGAGAGHCFQWMLIEGHGGPVCQWHPGNGDKRHN